MLKVLVLFAALGVAFYAYKRFSSKPAAGVVAVPPVVLKEPKLPAGKPLP